MSPLLLIDAIPDSIEIIVLTVIWFAGGIAGGFFLYRVRNKKDLGLFEAREKALGNREKELARIRSAMKAQIPAVNSDAHEATIALLREELEQNSLEISIANEEHNLELRILQDELESLRSGRRGAAGFAYEIDDVAFSTESSDKEATDRPEDVIEPTESADLAGDALETEHGANTAPESEDPESLSDEKTESVTDWAANIISYLFGEIDSIVDRDPGKSPARMSVPPEADPSSDQKLGERQVETGDITIPEFPRFKSLSELFPMLNLEASDQETLDLIESTTDVETVGLQMLLSLTDTEFRDLHEMGLDSYESIAQLSATDISNLSDKFEIPASRIERIWISGAQLRLYEGS